MFPQKASGRPACRAGPGGAPELGCQGRPIHLTDKSASLCLSCCADSVVRA